ncbi:hypothetical protein [Pseudomonas mandelii]|uniref:hypothetical protein n=1 Tax=Pseudomonas mandelii TaxID=75612 RepID=UPI00224ACB06|nr:hypothetical protein [Pseudomonas mandelii]MCX2898998.1 hypothetical protein [Pseudomonas mandelii]
MHAWKAVTVGLIVVLSGCVNHPLDCSMGVARDDCLPGTNGYANRQEALRSLAAAKELQSSRDDAQCQSYGAAPGSDAYVNCRVQLDNTNTDLQAHAEREKRQRLVQMLNLQNHKYQQPVPQPYAPKQTHCTSTAYGQTVSTDCY